MMRPVCFASALPDLYGSPFVEEEEHFIRSQGVQSIQQLKQGSSTSHKTCKQDLFDWSFGSRSSALIVGQNHAAFLAERVNCRTMPKCILVRFTVTPHTFEVFIDFIVARVRVQAVITGVLVCPPNTLRSAD